MAISANKEKQELYDPRKKVLSQMEVITFRILCLSFDSSYRKYSLNFNFNFL